MKGLRYLSILLSNVNFHTACNWWKRFAILTVLYLPLFSISNTALSQITVASEDFSATTNLTASVGGFGSGTNSSTCGNNDIFGISSNHPTPANLTTSGCGVTGYTGAFFGAMDVDACGGNTTTAKSISLLAYTVPNNNEITFSGDFGVMGSSNNSAGYTAVVTISFDGGSTFPTTLFTFTGNATTSFSCSCGGNITKAMATKTVSVGSNLSGQDLLIKVAFTGLSGNDRGIVLDEFKFIETVPACSAPTVQASALSFSNVGASSSDLSWTNGDGDNVLVVARATTDGLTDPTDGITYTANTIFGSGTLLGTDNYVVYKGTGTSVSVSGLENSTNYTYSLYAFNATGNCFMTPALSGNQSTTACANPTVAPSAALFSNVMASSLDLAWTNGNGDKVLVVARTTVAVLTDPSNGVTYTANTTFGSGTQIGTGNYVVYDGTGTSVSVTGLTKNTSYTFSIYAYNASSCYYLTELTATRTTSHNKFYVNDGSLTGDIYCSAIGTTGGSGTTADPFAELPDAIAAASTGDTIYVDAGTWVYTAGSSYTNPHNEIITIDQLAIIGAGMGETIFDDNMGANENYMLKITADDVILQDFTVTGFNNTGDAHALYIGDATNTYSGIYLSNVEFYDNGASSGNTYSKAVVVTAKTSATFYGGGTACNAPSSYNGGLWVKGTNINAVFSNYSFVGNTGDGFGGADGAGLVITGGDATQVVSLYNCIFEDNIQSSEDFNAMDIKMITGDLTVRNTLFNNSQSRMSAGTNIGGSVEISGGTAHFATSKFTNHGSTTGNLNGAAIGVTGGAVLVDSCYFNGNVGSGANDIHVSSGSLTVTYSTLTEIAQSGGTFTISNSGDPTVLSGTVTKSNTTAAPAFSDPSTPTYGGLCALDPVPLPVSLTRFEVTSHGKTANISWQTASELNSDFFTVERSADGVHFVALFRQKAGGNSLVYLNYTEMDNHPLDGISYYRLKQTDYDGKYSYSEVKTLMRKNGSTILFPNPVTQQQFQLAFESVCQQDVLLTIYKADGQFLYAEKIACELGTIQHSIALDSPKNGLYILTMQSPYQSFTPLKMEIINH